MPEGGGGHRKTVGARPRNGGRRCLGGGGVAPPRYRTPREEEGRPTTLGLPARKGVRQLLGRRSGATAGSGAQGRRKGARCLGPFRPGMKMRRLLGGGGEPPPVQTPEGGGEGVQSGWALRPEGFCGGPEGGGEEPPLPDDPREEERVTGFERAAMPGRRRASPPIAQVPGRRIGTSRKLTCRRRPRGRSQGSTGG